MKSTKFLILFAAFALFLTACGTPAVETPNDQTDTVATDPTAVTTVVTTAPTEATTTTVPTEAIVEDTSIVKTLEAGEHRFTLTLPASWNGAFTVRESDNSVIVYELTNHQYNSQGKLFTIRFVPESDYTEDMFPSYTELGSHGDCRVVALFPTDVQYEIDLADNYMALYDDVEDVVATIAFSD